MLNWDANLKIQKEKLFKFWDFLENMRTEIHSILAEYGLPYEFPPEVEAEADKIDRKKLPLQK